MIHHVSHANNRKGAAAAARGTVSIGNVARFSIKITKADRRPHSRYIKTEGNEFLGLSRRFDVAPPNAPPGELHYFLWQVTQSGQFFPPSHESPVHEWLVPVGLGWAFTTAIYLVMPIGFVLLPVSRRRAKVRWAHVGRVTVYSLILPWLFVVVSGAGFTGGMFYPPSMTIIVTTTVATGLLQLPLLVLWWTFAVGRYLRIPHGFVVASLLTIMWFLLLVLGIPLVMLAFE